VTGPAHVALVVGVAAAITWGLRALPFAALAQLRRSTVLEQLRWTMPLGVMVVLVVYTASTAGLDVGTAGLRYGVAVAVTIGLHLWRRNPGLSIVAGTATYVVLTALTS
jgi:branched-subunit amino acid transport protein AzlD